MNFLVPIIEENFGRGGKTFMANLTMVRQESMARLTTPTLPMNLLPISKRFMTKPIQIGPDNFLKIFLLPILFIIMIILLMIYLSIIFHGMIWSKLCQS